MRPNLPEICTVYGSVTRDRYADISLNAGVIENCLFRDISQDMRNVNHREEQNIQGTFWLTSSSVASLGKIIKYNGQLYRVENITRAKDLLNNDQVQFIKCQVSLYRAIS